MHFLHWPKCYFVTFLPLQIETNFKKSLNLRLNPVVSKNTKCASVAHYSLDKVMVWLKGQGKGGS